MPDYVVRRLMPIECERLQGFPDGWTDIHKKVVKKKDGTYGDRRDAGHAEVQGHGQQHGSSRDALDRRAHPESRGGSMRLLCMTFPPNKRAQEATEYAQFCKVREEYSEWVSAVVRKDSDPLEEAIDLMVALDGWLDKQPEEAVMAAVTKVLAKGVERGDWEACHD